jgi:hypothetical protein
MFWTIFVIVILSFITGAVVGGTAQDYIWYRMYKIELMNRLAEEKWGKVSCKYHSGH